MTMTFKTAPKLELKSVKVHVQLSEETPAYTAKLFVNGKHFADLSNSGHGGCDSVDPAKGAYNNPQFHKDLKALEAAVAEFFPKLDFVHDGKKIDTSLECECHGLVWKNVDMRNFSSKLSRTFTFFVMHDSAVYGWKKGKFTMEALTAHVQAKYGKDVVILNNLPKEEAFKIFQANT